MKNSELEKNIRWLDRLLKVYLLWNAFVIVTVVYLVLTTGAE